MFMYSCGHASGDQAQAQAKNLINVHKPCVACWGAQRRSLKEAK